MRILHVIPSFAPAWRYGGPVRAAYEMTRGLVKRGHEVTVITSNLDGDGILNVPISKPVDLDGVNVRYFPLSFPKKYLYSKLMNAAFREEIPKCDLVHIHSLYYWPTTAAAWYARKYRVPYIMRPAGSLDPICLEKRYEGLLESSRSRLKKKLYWNLIGAREFNSAAAVHFTSQGEQEAAHPLITGPMEFVVPLGVEDPPTQAPLHPGIAKALQAAGDRPILLFLSRIDAKKGLGLLIEALAALRNQGRRFLLIVAGDGSPDQERLLAKTIADSKLQDSVVCVGRIEGDSRWQLFRSARAMILPSHHENFGIAVAESLACRTPVIISDRVNIHHVVSQSRAGLVCGLDPKDLARQIDKLLHDDELHHHMSQNARRCFEANFQWGHSLAALEKVYQALASQKTNVSSR